MRIIVIEDKAYRVTNKECEKLQKMQEEAEKSTYPLSATLEEELNIYLDDAKKNYKCLGAIFFDCHR